MHRICDLRRWPRVCVRTLPVVAAVAILAGCASTFPLMPTPVMYRGEQANPLFTEVPADRQKPSIDLLYVTDRAPATKPCEPLPYSAKRSRSMAFGSVTVEFGEGVAWDTLVKQSTVTERWVPIDLTLGPTKELGRFPSIVYGVTVTPAGITRAPAVIDAHERAAAGLQGEIARRLADSPRKEVVLYVHGYHNTFREAAFTMAELCHFLGREFVCAIFTWPAGGTRGVFFGYLEDRESGEFAVEDLKKTIRMIADTPGVERVHLLAHSRGTDVLATAMSEIAIEAYTTQTTLDRRFKVRNIVLMAPDMDFDVAVSKIFKVISDPDLPYGNAPNPRGTFPPPGLHLTFYVSHDDKALSVSQFLFGSLARLGRVDESMFSEEQIERGRRAGIFDIIQVSGTTDLFGHSYFTSNPAVSSDLIALLRYGLKPGEPGRPLVEIARPFWQVPTAMPSVGRYRAEG